MRVTTSNQFKRDLRLAKRRGRDPEKLWTFVDLLLAGTTAPAQYMLHRLSGDYAGCFECHIEPDWLLIWEIGENILLLRTGTHADLF